MQLKSSLGKKEVIPGGREYVIKLLLEGRRVLKRPVGFVLVHEYHVIKDRLGDAHQRGDLTVHVGTSIAKADLLHSYKVRQGSACQRDVNW